jgi:hypothetical protein
MQVTWFSSVTELNITNIVLLPCVTTKTKYTACQIRTRDQIEQLLRHCCTADRLSYHPHSFTLGPGRSDAWLWWMERLSLTAWGDFPSLSGGLCRSQRQRNDFCALCGWQHLVRKRRCSGVQGHVRTELLCQSFCKRLTNLLIRWPEVIT